MSAYVWIAAIASVCSVVLAVVAEVKTYRFAPLFLLPIIWGMLLLRRRLHLNPVIYALFVLAVLLHNLGALGYYQRGFLGVSFDVYVHFYFPLVGAFIVHRYFQSELPLGSWGLRLATLLCIMGGGAIHEILEYASYLALGEEKGMLKPTTSYFFDTQRDLTSNLAGCIAGLALIALGDFWFVGPQRRAESPAAEVPLKVVK